MLATSVRLLRLLSLLQARRDWSGAELAGRLGVKPYRIAYLHTTGKVPDLMAEFSLERFTTGRLVDEHGAAGVAH